MGTVKIFSSTDGLNDIKNEAIRNLIAILKTPKFWSTVNLRPNFIKGDVH